MYGYDNIPSSLPLMEMTKGNLTPKQSNERFVRDVLVDLGLHETLTYTPVSYTHLDVYKRQGLKSMEHVYKMHKVLINIKHTVKWLLLWEMKDRGFIRKF